MMHHSVVFYSPSAAQRVVSHSMSGYMRAQSCTMTSKYDDRIVLLFLEFGLCLHKVAKVGHRQSASSHTGVHA